MPLLLGLAAAITAAGMQQQPVATADAPASENVVTVGSEAPAARLLTIPAGTMVRLMVLKEVNSRDHRAGDRFVLRVDEDVVIGGVNAIPVGTRAWGEVVGAEGTGGVGKSGRINARLLYLELNGQRVRLSGERQSSGPGAGGQVVLSVLAFGPLGLLMKGNDAKLKAGDLLTGYTAEEHAITTSQAAK